MDSEVIEALIQFELRELWNGVLNDKIDIVKFKKETGGKYFTEIKDVYDNTPEGQAVDAFIGLAQ
jgi:hypothetical protein